MEISEKNKQKLIYAGIVLAVIWIVFLWPHTDIWDGEGEISVFAKNDSVKNYRVTAQIEVTRHRNGWMYSKSNSEYNVTSFDWTNGGYADLDDCIVKNKDRSDCKDQDGNSYSIEVTTPPDQPESDYSSDY